MSDVNDAVMVSGTETGKWHKKSLTGKCDSNWPTEHCVDILELYSLQYSFNSEHPMMYDFHVHPNNKNNEYQTHYFSKSKSKSIKGDAGTVITTRPGTYCFNFNPVTRLKTNSVIYLTYKLEEASHQ